MNWLRTSTTVIALIGIIGLVGCQPSVPLDFSSRLMGFGQTQQTFPTNNNNNFSDIINQNPPSNPNPPPTSQGTSPTTCSRYSNPAQNVVNACGQVINFYEQDVEEVAPGCVSAFRNIAPQSDCNTLIPQLNRAFSACSVIFTTYSNYLPYQCNVALQTLKSS